MRDALAEARRQLGRDATVLHTKQYEDPVWFGIGRRRGVEILAAVDTSAPQPAAASCRTAAEGVPAEVARQLKDIRELLAKLEDSRSPREDKDDSPALARLVRSGVPAEIAQVLAAEVDGMQDYGIILDIVARRIRCGGPIGFGTGHARVALIGPTGVGKTTTAAKLAAQYRLARKRSVALLTLDTYRIGAVEQLATYARILDIPLEVALCPEDASALVDKHSDKDLVIIDTVGRSQRNRAHLEELSRFVRAANPTEVHLAVSASASAAAQKEAVESFGALSADRLILTKLDECPQPGCILGLAATSLLPFSYITCGQEVPDDIAVAEPEHLARLVWEGHRG